jgi:hypothetical protein
MLSTISAADRFGADGINNTAIVQAHLSWLPDDVYNRWRSILHQPFHRTYLLAIQVMGVHVVFTTRLSSFYRVPPVL